MKSKCGWLPIASLAVAVLAAGTGVEAWIKALQIERRVDGELLLVSLRQRVLSLRSSNEQHLRKNAMETAQQVQADLMKAGMLERGMKVSDAIVAYGKIDPREIPGDSPSRVEVWLMDVILNALE